MIFIWCGGRKLSRDELIKPKKKKKKNSTLLLIHFLTLSDRQKNQLIIFRLKVEIKTGREQNKKVRN